MVKGVLHGKGSCCMVKGVLHGKGWCCTVKGGAVW